MSRSDGTSDLYTLNAVNQIANIYSVGQPLNPHTTFTYDLNGNTASMTDTATQVTIEFDYDYENRLAGITYPSGTTEFVYDALGRRLKRIEKKTRSALLQEAAEQYAEGVRVRDARKFLREWSDEEVTQWLKEDKDSEKNVRAIKAKPAG